MNDELQAFFEDPTAENFLAARAEILADRAYRPGSRELARLDELSAADRPQELRAAVEQMMPGWALSPRVHFLAGLAAEQRDDQQEVELRRFLVRVCLDGLLASGEGTRDNPYRVTRVSDERDLLAARDRRARRQCLVRDNGRLLDVILCDDDSEVWFDVSQVVVPAESEEQIAAAGR